VYANKIMHTVVWLNLLIKVSH